MLILWHLPRIHEFEKLQPASQQRNRSIHCIDRRQSPNWIDERLKWEYGKHGSEDRTKTRLPGSQPLATDPEGQESTRTVSTGQAAFAATLYAVPLRK